MSKTAGILGKTSDEETYRNLHTRIAEAFQQEFVSPNGRISSETQTAHILSLHFGLLKEKDRQRAVDSLVKLLEENRWHTTTGFLGTPYICQVLSDNGRIDAAYKLILQEDYPSWLYQVKKGATTIWEHWDGIKEDGSFWSADMNSFNHYAYGAVGDWLYRHIGGINLDENHPGYRRFRLTPLPIEDISCGDTELVTLYGTIRSTWHIKKDRFEWTVTIPHNTEAELTFPYAGARTKIETRGTEKDMPFYREKEGVKAVLGSGRYTFAYPLDEKRMTPLPADPEKHPWE